MSKRITSLRSRDAPSNPCPECGVSRRTPAAPIRDMRLLYQGLNRLHEIGIGVNHTVGHEERTNDTLVTEGPVYANEILFFLSNSNKLVRSIAAIVT